MAIAQAYPVQLDLDSPLEVARWRPLVHWLLVIPHVIVVYLLNAAVGVVTFIAWFAILFTGKYPEGLFNFAVGVHRYQWRVVTYMLWMRESYPPFEFSGPLTDPGADPARLSVQYPEKLSRGLIFVKWLLVIPHAIVLLFLLIGAYIVTAIGFFAVLITGRWPEGLRNYVVGTIRWAMRVQLYGNLMTDVYPPFSLS